MLSVTVPAKEILTGADGPVFSASVSSVSSQIKVAVMLELLKWWQCHQTSSEGDLVTQRFARWEVASHSLSVTIYPTSQLLNLFLKATSPIWRLVCHLAFFISCEASLPNWRLFVFWSYCAPDRLCFVAHCRGSYDQITAFPLCVFFAQCLWTGAERKGVQIIQRALNKTGGPVP